jgi:hypothetical protein
MLYNSILFRWVGAGEFKLNTIKGKPVLYKLVI